MNTRVILTLLFLMLYFRDSYAQVSVFPSKTPPMEISAGISDNARDSLIDFATILINKYAELGTLLDRNSEVNEKSVEKFRKLFYASAELQADYRENPSEKYNTVAEYTAEVYKRLRFEGVKFKIESAVILGMQYDQAGIYTLNLKVTKLIFNPLNDNGMVRSIASGKRVTQFFTLSCEEGIIHTLRIYKIKGVALKPSANYVRFSGVTVGVGEQKISVSNSQLWETAHKSQSSFSVTSGPVLSGGFEFTTNRLPFNRSGSKKVFLNTGVFIEQMSILTKIDNFGIDYFSADASDSDNNIFMYLRKVSSLNASEKINLTSVSVPVGFSLSVKSTPRTDFLIGIRLKPGFVVSQNGSMTGEGFYTAFVGASNWNTDIKTAFNTAVIDDSNAYLPLIVRKRELSGEPKPGLRSFSLTASLSPRYYRRLSARNPSASLMIGVDFNFGLTSPFVHNSSESDLFTFPDKYEESVLTHYSKNMTSLGVSFIIGVHQQLSSSK